MAALISGWLILLSNLTCTGVDLERLAWFPDGASFGSVTEVNDSSVERVNSHSWLTREDLTLLQPSENLV